MSEQTSIIERPQSGLERIKTAILSPETKARFSDMMGANAIYYLNQVMIVVANSPKLQECQPSSVLISAMRAASLKLSVDPAQGQAWIIPYNGVATFQLGYKGIYELAMRSNLYRYINVPQVFEGEEVIEDRMTGMHTITGKPISKKIIGWLMYFEMFNGYKKTFYMSCEEIADHAARYSASYKRSDSKWHDERERPKMERKTVLVNGLRKWGRFNPGDQDIIDQIEAEQEWVSRDGEIDASFTVEEPTEKKTPVEIMGDLYDGEPAASKTEEPKADQPALIPDEKKDDQPAHVEYSGHLSKIGKDHAYPTTWQQYLMPKLTRFGINAFELGGILWKHNIPQDTAPIEVENIVNKHLEAKRATPIEQAQ